MMHDQVLREKFIREYTATHSRSPSLIEIREGLEQLRLLYSDLANKGVSGTDLVLPEFGSTSSASDELANRMAVRYDLKASSQKIRKLSQELEDDYRFFRVKLGRIKQQAMAMDGYLDDTLLSLAREDAFTAAATEDFSMVLSLPDLEHSDALIEGGLCMAARQTLKKVPLDQAKITFVASSDANILGTTASAPAKSVLELDGQTYEYLVLLDKQRATVNLVVTIEFAEPTDVGELRASTTRLASFGNETYTAFYSYNGTDYQLLEPSLRPYNNDRIFVSVNRNKIKSLRLVFTKAIADSRTTSFGQWSFGWQFDAIEVFETSFAPDSTSTFIGSYNMNQSGSVSPFEGFCSKVTLEVCTVEPEGTHISWLVSGDGENYRPINPYKQGVDIVSIRPRDSSSGVLKLQNSENSWKLLDPRKTAGLNVMAPNVWVLNTYFAASDRPPDPATVHLWLDRWNDDKDSGWNLNAAGNLEIQIAIEAPAGKTVNLGPRSAKLNGRVVSGITWIPSGFSTFETSPDNYVFVDGGATDEDILRTLDPLYPYNHKYVIEGYSYDPSYQGTRLYTGVDGAVGIVVNYEEPEDFDNDTQIWTWTYDFFPGLGWLILVRIDPTAAGILDATHHFQYDGTPLLNQDQTSKQIFVKAILHTSSKGDTPIIDWFTIRGI